MNSSNVVLRSSSGPPVMVPNQLSYDPPVPASPPPSYSESQRLESLRGRFWSTVNKAHAFFRPVAKSSQAKPAPGLNTVRPYSFKCLKDYTVDIFHCTMTMLETTFKGAAYGSFIGLAAGLVAVAACPPAIEIAIPAGAISGTISGFIIGGKRGMRKAVEKFESRRAERYDSDPYYKPYQRLHDAQQAQETYPSAPVQYLLEIPGDNPLYQDL